MKFDWYQGSVPEVRPGLIMEAVSDSDYFGQWVECKPLKGYDIGAQFTVGDQVKFRINHGGHNEEHGANIQGSGQNAPVLADILRRDFPAHRVSRVDACEDFFHADAYSYFRKHSLKIAANRRVKAREITKPLLASDDGCTLYLGAPTSSTIVRIYEKGKQLGLRPEWVRLESQNRPQKEMKALLATLNPEQIWALSDWTLDIAKVMGQGNLQRVNAVLHDPADAEKAYATLMRQYGKILNKKAQHLGSWEALGTKMGHDYQQGLEKAPKAVLELLNRQKNS